MEVKRRFQVHLKYQLEVDFTVFGSYTTLFLFFQISPRWSFCMPLSVIMIVICVIIYRSIILINIVFVHGRLRRPSIVKHKLMLLSPFSFT